MLSGSRRALHNAHRSIPGLSRNELPETPPVTPVAPDLRPFKRWLLRHQAGFAVAGGSNATLKAGIATVNDTFTRRRLHRGIPFQNADYHRNRRRLRFYQAISHYGIFVYWLTFHNEFFPTA